MASTAAIEKAVFTEQLTMDETIDLLRQHDLETVTLAFAYTLFSLKDTLASLHSLTSQQQGQRLEQAIVGGLIDHALTTGHIDHDTAVAYLIKDGSLPDVAENHVQIIETIAAHDKERADFLADPDNSKRYCTRCGRETTADLISTRGICYTCGSEAVLSNAYEIRAKEGPYFRRWASGMLRAMYEIENQLLEESRQETEAWYCTKCDTLNSIEREKCRECNIARWDLGN